jgi:hypothetical protein
VTLTIADLQNILRGVAQLSGVRVTQPFEVVAPHMVHMEGAINIHGQTFYWETDIDLRDLKTRQDIATLIESLLTSFAKAEKGQVANQ